MNKKISHYRIELNSAENVRELLQEIYQLANEQILQAQNEINKLASSSELKDEIMDSRVKYAKAVNDYMNMRDKAIKTKLDVARLLTEIMEHNGNVQNALDDEILSRKTGFDPNKFQSYIDEVLDKNNDGKKTIELKK